MVLSSTTPRRQQRVREDPMVYTNCRNELRNEGGHCLQTGLRHTGLPTLRSLLPVRVVTDVPSLTRICDTIAQPGFSLALALLVHFFT
eukprot:3909978-Amphidinium_carterae.4